MLGWRSWVWKEFRLGSKGNGEPWEDLCWGQVARSGVCFRKKSLWLGLGGGRMERGCNQQDGKRVGGGVGRGWLLGQGTGGRETGGFEGDSGSRMSWIGCRYGGRVWSEDASWISAWFPSRQALGEVPGLRTWDAWLHFPPVYGCNVPACFPPFVRFYFPCLEFSSNPSGHPGGESAGKKFPHPSGWPTRQGRGCPGLTLFLFLPGEPTGRASWNLEEGRGIPAMGTSFPTPSRT